MTITDEVIENIDTEIASHEPERGGLLFGPIGRDFITLFVPDMTAVTTTVTYQISLEMCSRAPIIERETQLEYKGIVHSHPGSYDSPSSGDENSASNALNANPQLSKFFMPIVTCLKSKNKYEHERPLQHGKLSNYCAFRSRKNPLNGNVSVKTEPIRVMPFKTHLRELCKHLSGSGVHIKMRENGITIFQENIYQLAYVLTLDHADIIVLAGEDYPYFSPHLLFTNKGDSTQSIPLFWDMFHPVETRLLNAFLEVSKIKDLLKSDQLTKPLCHASA